MTQAPVIWLYRFCIDGIDTKKQTTLSIKWFTFLLAMAIALFFEQ